MILQNGVMGWGLSGFLEALSDMYGDVEELIRLISRDGLWGDGTKKHSPMQRPLVTEKSVPTKAALPVQVAVQAPTYGLKKCKEWPTDEVAALKPREQYGAVETVAVISEDEGDGTRAGTREESLVLKRVKTEGEKVESNSGIAKSTSQLESIASSIYLNGFKFRSTTKLRSLGS
jgi:hypothetical protein